MAKQEKLATSDFNLQKISTAEFVHHLRGSIFAKSNCAVFGRRGSGKTEIAKEVIRQTKVYHKGQWRTCVEVYMNLSVFERVDMGGYPNLFNADPNDHYVSFKLPDFYRLMIEEDSPVVALLDEVDKADPSLWAPLLEFTQFHSMNGRKLPNLICCVMTGNLISEGGQRPSPPLLDRTEKYLIEPDTGAWLKWAGEKGGIHPAVTSYLQDHAKDLFGDTDMGDNYASTSPRSWTHVSKILTAIDAATKENGGSDVIPYAILEQKVSGCIGKEVGLRFKVYFDHYHNLIPIVSALLKSENIEKDLKDFMGRQYRELDPSKKLVACSIACSRAATLIDSKGDLSIKKYPKDDQRYLENIGAFLNSFDSEVIMFAVRAQITVNRLMSCKIMDSTIWRALVERTKMNAS